MFPSTVRSIFYLSLRIWIGLTVLNAALCPAEILYRHFLSPHTAWWNSNGDFISVTGNITTTNFLPAGRYMLADTGRQQITNFDIGGSGVPAGTVVAPSGQSLCCDACDLGFCPYGTRDLHAVYLLEYYSRQVVGTAQGGFVVSDVPIVGGNWITLVVPNEYTITYGATPLDSNNSGSDGDRCSQGMASYNINKALAALVLTDTPLGYQPARGPAVNFTVSYNSQSWQPARSAACLRQVVTLELDNVTDRRFFIHGTALYS